jgi:cytoskeletal protein RodZ
MSTVAEQLRQAREARQMTLEQVADITKMRTDHLRALEQGDFDAFSAPVYIKGFVRTYSTLLKLDVPQVMSALDTELSATKKFAEPPSLSGESGGVIDFMMLQLSKLDLRKGIMVLFAFVVIGSSLIGYLAWHHARSADPLKDLKPGLYKPERKNSGETLPVPSNPPAKR